MLADPSLQNVQTVIPLRFGCVMPNPSEVKKFIDARAETLLDALTRLRNRSEFSVRVRFESEGAVSDDLAGIPAGVAEFLREVASDMDHAPNAEGIADRIHGHLARFAGEAMRNPVLEADMILNATFLITTASEEDFREEVRRLSRESQALGIQIEVSGPWPPYHFVDVDFGDDLVSLMGNRIDHTPNSRYDSQELNWGLFSVRPADFVRRPDVFYSHR